MLWGPEALHEEDERYPVGLLEFSGVGLSPSSKEPEGVACSSVGTLDTLLKQSVIPASALIQFPYFHTCVPSLLLTKAGSDTHQ